MAAITLSKPHRPDGRTRLLTAAETLFAQGGFDDVSVSKILEMSELKAPSLYHHFGDKEGLYTTWVTTTLDALGQRLQEIQPDNLATLAETILDGAKFDYLQIQRDLRSLTKEENRNQITLALEKNLFQPALEMIHKMQPAKEPNECAYLFLHIVMYAHPVYTSQRPASDSQGNIIEWVTSQFCGAKH